VKKKPKLCCIWLTFCFVLHLLITPVTAAAAAPDNKKPDKSTGAGRPSYVAGEVIVKFRPDISQAQADDAKKKVKIKTVKKHSLTGTELAKIEDGADVNQVVSQLKKDPNVLYAQPNYIYYPTATTVNDPDFGKLWGLDNIGQTINGSVGVTDKDIDAPEAWDITMGSSTVVVAVIDEGVDINHPDIAGNIWINSDEIAANGIDDDGNGKIDDVNGWDFYNNDNTVFDPEDVDQHGTHVAGTIAAVANNAAGIAGVAPNVKIMPLKWLGPDGGTTSDAIAAIQYAKDNRARISNNSWVGNSNDLALKEAINNSGMVFVAAAGNDGLNIDTSPAYPAAFDNTNIVSVAAVNNQGSLSNFSNYGSISVDVGGPGEQIYSLRPVYPAMGAAVQIYDAVYGYKAVHLGFGLEDLANSADRAAVIQRALSFLDTDTSTPIMLVDDDNSELNSSQYTDYYQVFADALSGYSVVQVVYAGDTANGPDSTTMAGKTVIWFTGDAYGKDNPNDYTLTLTDIVNLCDFLDRGGRLLLIGNDLAYGTAASPLFTTYMEENIIEDFSPTGTVTDTVYGSTYSLASSTDRDTLIPIQAGLSSVMYNYAASDPATSYQYMSGTSMAAPHVAGIAALMLSVNPSLTNDQIISLLKQTVDPLPSLSGKTATGGMVNAYRAVLAAKVPDTPTGFNATPGNQTVQLNWNPVSDGDLAGYNIYRNNVKINGTPLTGTTYTDTGLTNGTSYDYQVSAVDTYGFESPRTAILSATPNQISVTLTVTGQTAVKNGDTLQFGGSAMVTASVYSAKLEQLDANGQPIPAADISVTPTINPSTGVISGNYTVASFHPNATSVRLNLTVDDGGAKYTGVSAPLTIDNTRPTVSLLYSRTSPVNAGPLTITATFSEPLMGTPTIYIDQPGVTDIAGAAMTPTTDPKIWTYNYTVSSGAGYADGIATVTIQGVDGAGNANTTASANTFIIDTTAPPPPVISQVGGKNSPAQSNNASPQVVVDNVYSGDTIKIYDGTALVTSQVAGGSSVTIPLTGLSEGLHSLTAKATDAAGNTSGSSSVFSYTVDLTAPAAPVIALVDGKTSPAASTNANPQVVVTGVNSGDTIEIYEGATLLNSATAAGGSVTISLTGLAEATHSLTAKAIDPAGNVSNVSSAFSYTVDITPPSITGKTPPANAIGVLAVNNLEILFSEPMKSTTITSANITLTSAVYGSEAITVTYDSSENKAVIDPINRLKYATQYTVTVNAVYDLAGNVLTGVPVTWNFTTEADTYPPEIVPVTASTNVPISSVITFGFDEDVVYSSVYDAIYNNQIKLLNGTVTVAASVYYNQSTKLITITPATTLQYGTTYTLSVTGVSDLLNNTIISPRTWNFTTVAAPSSGGGGGGAPAVSTGSASGEVVLPVNALISSSSVTGAQNIINVIVDSTAALPSVKQSLSGSTVVVKVNQASDVVKVQLAADVIAAIADKDGAVKVQAPGRSYVLAADELKLAELAQQLGVKSSDVKINITIALANPEQLSAVQKAVEGKGLVQVIAPVDFKVEGAAEGKSVEVKGFAGYVSRELELPRSVNVNNATGVVLNADGTLSPVPTQFKTINGKTVAVIKRKSNSIYTVVENRKAFADVSNHWAKDDINTLASRLIISGKSENTYGPEDPVTRAQFVTLIVKALGLEMNPAKAAFTDLNSNDWYAGAVGTAVEAGIINGYADGTFRPNNCITREEVAAIIVQAMKVTGKSETMNAEDANRYLARFADGASIGNWARQAVAVAVKNGIIKGNSNGSFVPVKNCTRAESAVMIKKMLETVSFI